MTTLAGASRSLRLDEQRLLGAVAVSSVGTWSYNVGIAVFAYQETQSPTWVAAATVGRYVPALVITAVGSRWVDRLPRRDVAAAADVVCALVMLALTVVAASHGSLVLAIGLAALSSGISRIQTSAALAMAADIVPESRLAATAATLSTTEAVATAAGPALASVVLALSTPMALFALNAASFGASAVLILGIRAVDGARAPRRRRPHQHHGDADVATRLVWPLIAARSVLAVVYGADVVLLAVIATVQLHQGTAGYGWLLAAAGAGGLLAASRLRRDRRDVLTRLAVPLATAAYSLPLMLFVLAPGAAESMAVQALRGAGLVAATTVVLRGLQTSVPSAVAGRVFGLTQVAMLLGTSAGAIVAPLLLARFGLDTTLVAFAVVPAAVVVALVPGLRAFDVRRTAISAALEPQVDLLRRLDLFHEASRATLCSVADACRTTTFAAGDVVIEQGADSDCLHVIVEGTVEVYVDEGDGPRLVRTMAAPAYVGEIGLVQNRVRTATVVATTPVTTWRVEGTAFLDAVLSAGISGALMDGVRARLATG